METDKVKTFSWSIPLYLSFPTKKATYCEAYQYLEWNLWDFEV